MVKNKPSKRRTLWRFRMRRNKAKQKRRYFSQRGKYRKGWYDDYLSNKNMNANRLRKRR